MKEYETMENYNCALKHKPLLRSWLKLVNTLLNVIREENKYFFYKRNN